MVSLRSLAFGATMFSSSALNNLFVTYYITYFTTIVGLTQRSFVIGQTVFMCVFFTRLPLLCRVPVPLRGCLSPGAGMQ
jgi:hypothetical protein